MGCTVISSLDTRTQWTVSCRLPTMSSSQVARMATSGLCIFSHTGDNQSLFFGIFLLSYESHSLWPYCGTVSRNGEIEEWRFTLVWSLWPCLKCTSTTNDLETRIILQLSASVHWMKIPIQVPWGGWSPWWFIPSGEVGCKHNRRACWFNLPRQ